MTPAELANAACARDALSAFRRLTNPTKETPVSDHIEARRRLTEAYQTINAHDREPGAAWQVQASQAHMLAAIHDLLAERLPTKGDPCPCGCRLNVEVQLAPESCGCYSDDEACETHDAPEPDTLAEALYALPDGTVVYTATGERFTQAFGEWRCDMAHCAGSDYCRITDHLVRYAPIGIESIPGEDVLPLWPSWSLQWGTARYAGMLVGSDGKPRKPEAVTVTLPRDVAQRAANNLRDAAGLSRASYRSVMADRFADAADALERAL